MSFPVLKLLVSLGILLAGVVLGWLYLRKPSIPRDVHATALVGQRPWRRLGGAICLVLGVMFILGVYVVDVPDHPRVYLAYWTVMMGLVMWLCVLATKDILYTRKLIARRRDGRAVRGKPISASQVAREEPEP